MTGSQKSPIYRKKHFFKIDGTDNIEKRITLDINAIENKSLEDFVSSNTLNFFSITGISSGFLKKKVEDWEDDAEYQKSRQLVRCMRVVNDIAERGVALMDEYNKIHTNNEEQNSTYYC